jgi:hypothetical protein
MFNDFASKTKEQQTEGTKFPDLLWYLVEDHQMEWKWSKKCFFFVKQ